MGDSFVAIAIVLLSLLIEPNDFKLSAEMKNWENAKLHCAKRGGQLAILDDEITNQVRARHFFCYG